MSKEIILQVGGGIGKNIVATALLQAIKKNYEGSNIIVVTGWPEIFRRNPNVHKVYRFGNTNYFYNEHIKGKDPMIFAQEVYLSNQHIVEQKPLRQSWIEMFGMEYDNEMPELFFNPVMEEDIKEQFAREKPVLLIHSNGGPIPQQEVKSHYSWVRDMPKRFVKKLVNELKDRYHIMQCCNHQSQVIPEVEIVEGLNELEIMALLKCTSKRLLIDSCLQHGAAALNIESTVLWIANKPEVWGYSIHDNILPSAKPVYKSDSLELYNEYDINSPKDQYPYATDEIFDMKDVLSSVEQQYYAEDLDAN